MPDSRLRQTARSNGAGLLGISTRGLLWGMVIIGFCLGSGSPGYGFESYEKFKKSNKQSQPLTLEALPGKDPVRPGDTFRLYVVAVLDKGWHMYSIEKQSRDETVATLIELETLAFHPEGPWRETPPKLVRDEVLEKIMKTHSGRVEFTRLLRVPEGLQPGAYPISGTFRFRTCDNRICTLPQTKRFQTRVIVKAGEPG